MPEPLREFTRKELAGANGAGGQPAYLVYQGKVFDVSQSRLWESGQHMGLHQAGADLTREIDDAPHGEEVLERYPQVGVVKKEEQQSQVARPNALFRLLDRFPILKRHPHPMLVHFPLVFMLSATGFNLLYLFTGHKPFEVTGLHCLVGGVLFTPLAMITGLFTWWLNYQARLLKAVIIKMILAPLLLSVGTLAFLWRLAEPGILDHLHGGALVYLSLIILLTPLAVTIGWYGATLTFPLHEEGE